MSDSSAVTDRRLLGLGPRQLGILERLTAEEWTPAWKLADHPFGGGCEHAKVLQSITALKRRGLVETRRMTDFSYLEDATPGRAWNGTHARLRRNAARALEAAPPAPPPRRRGPYPGTLATIAAIRSLRVEGLTFPQISEQLDRPVNSLRATWAKHATTEDRAAITAAGRARNSVRPETLETLAAIRPLLLTEGLAWPEISERLGRPTSALYWVWDTYACAEDRAAANAAGHARAEADERDQRGRVIDAVRDWDALFGAPPKALDWDTARRQHPSARYQATGRAWPSIGVVRRLFGSWNAMIVAAGLTPRPAQQPPPQRPHPPRPCTICGKPYRPLRKERCNACYGYWRRHGHDRPSPRSTTIRT